MTCLRKEFDSNLCSAENLPSLESIKLMCLVVYHYVQLYNIHGKMLQGCLVQVGNDIELDTVGRQFEPSRRRRNRSHCGVTSGWQGTLFPGQHSRGNKAAANLSLFYRA